MPDFEEPSVLYEESKIGAEVEIQDRSEESLIQSKYMGTDSDRHDMMMLGKKQVLRVCRSAAIRLSGHD